MVVGEVAFLGDVLEAAVVLEERGRTLERDSIRDPRVWILPRRRFVPTCRRPWVCWPRACAIAICKQKVCLNFFCIIIIIIFFFFF